MSDKGYWENVYWPRVMKQRLSRRRLIQIGALGTAGAVSAVYLGCSGGSKTNGGTPAAGKTAAPAGTPKPGGTISTVILGILSSLDPVYVKGGTDRLATYNIYDAPISHSLQANGSLAVVGSLAESWEWVDDTHLNMTFRKGIKFTDGTDFDAAAVKYNVDRMEDPKTASPRAAELAAVDHLELSSDPYTMTYVLKKPDYVFLSTLYPWTSAVCSPTAIEKWGDDYANHPTGTGPFMLKGSATAAAVEFVENPDYWRSGEPYLDGYTIRLMSDSAVVASAFNTGELDIDFTGALDSADVVSFQNDPKFNVVTAGAAGILRIFINTSRPPLDNVHLRRALSLAVNRQEFVSKYNGLNFITPSPLPRHSAYDNPDQPDPEFNLDKAKEEMKAAGFENGVDITLSTFNTPVVTSDGELLIEQFSKIGVNCSLYTGSDMTAKAVNGDFELLYTNWPTDYSSIDYAMRQVYHSNSAFNHGVSSDPQMDALIDQAALEPDPNKRKQLYWQVMKMVVDNVYDISVSGLPQLAVMRSNVQGFIPGDQPGGPELAFSFRRLWLSS